MPRDFLTFFGGGGASSVSPSDKGSECPGCNGKVNETSHADCNDTHGERTVRNLRRDV